LRTGAPFFLFEERFKRVGDSKSNCVHAGPFFCACVGATKGTPSPKSSPGTRRSKFKAVKYWKHFVLNGLTLTRSMNLKMDERARRHEPSGWRAAFTPLQLPMLRDLCTWKRRERRAPVQGFNARTISGNSPPCLIEG
jgi:hypothetical protein